MNRRRVVIGLCALLAGLAAVPRTAAADDPTLVVLAASSLTESLQRAGAAWTAKGHPRVTFSFDSSSKLARQVEAGAPADAFFSADTEWMDYVDGKGLIEAATRVNLLGNSLVAVVPVASSTAITSAGDLAKPQIKRLALAGDNVPAGRYARAALGSLGLWQAVEGRVVRGDNVRTVLGWVATGEADAGAVYATDANVEPRVKVAFSFPASSHPPIVYPAAALKNAAQVGAAAAFVAWCRSTEGMAIFLAAGFTAAPAQ